jgi:hypothetical protein
MPTSPIAQIVPTALRDQLANETTGLNARIAALAEAYGIEPFEIDWTDTSTNFLFGRLDPALLEESSVFTYPFVTIDTARMSDVRRVKFSVFSGPVLGLIEVHHSWQQESVIADFGALVNATADAVMNCLNDQSTQAWPGNLLWNGRAEMLPGPLRMGGQGWLRTTQFICPFDLTV